MNCNHLRAVLAGIISVMTLLAILFLWPAGCTGTQAQFTTDLAIPAQADWVDYGPIFERGDLGEWDYLLWGGFAATAVKKNGVYFLYYQGSSGYRLVPDETVTWRTIGVATSPDGINFTKYSGNPVVAWFPNNGGEEGAVSGGAVLDPGGEIVLYYGANSETSPTQVSADGLLTVSANGLNFTDAGVVLDHQNGALWGAGDELFPIIAIQDSGKWFVYYIPNGTFQQRSLGVAWGNSRTSLSSSAGATSAGRSIRAWGTGGAAKVGPGTYALFLNDVTRSTTEVRLVSLTAPNQLSAPVAVYQFDGVQQTTVLLDQAAGTWFMYYRGPNSYGVKLAPAGRRDTTPPTAPVSVRASPTSEGQVDLSWNPATDAETGIVAYNVFRNATKLATVKGWKFSDTGLPERTRYNYQVSAVNYHGLEGPRSAAAAAVTLADRTPPKISSVTTGSNPNQVSLVFDEPVDRNSAETGTNYTINNGVRVTGAVLGPDQKSVTLATSAHVNGSYRLAVRNVRDRASAPNPVAPNTTANYLYTGLSNLAAAWTLDEAAGDTAFDLAAYGNDGALTYLIKPNLVKPGPVWVPGKFGQALQFDGIDDQVTIDGAGPLKEVTGGSHTFAAWVNPESAPPATTANDSAYSILVRQSTGLYYDQSQKFRAEVQLANGTRVAVSSGVFQPGAWYHVTLVADDTGKKLHLYVDGQEVSGSPAGYSGALADHGDAPYYLGASEPLANLYEYRFKGKLDEVRIYRRALGRAEVQHLFAWTPLFLNQLPVYLPAIVK